MVSCTLTTTVDNVVKPIKCIHTGLWSFAGVCVCVCVCVRVVCVQFQCACMCSCLSCAAENKLCMLMGIKHFDYVLYIQSGLHFTPEYRNQIRPHTHTHAHTHAR